MKEVKYKVAEINVSYRPKRNIDHSPVITDSSDAATYLFEGFNKSTMALQEQFVVMYLNMSNKVIGLYRASVGGMTGTVADPRLILVTGLKLGCIGILLAHNHPSGNLKPSKMDEEITRKIKEGAKLLDMKVLDHLILNGKGDYYSFADKGIL